MSENERRLRDSFESLLCGSLLDVYRSFLTYVSYLSHGRKCKSSQQKHDSDEQRLKDSHWVSFVGFI